MELGEMTRCVKTHRTQKGATHFLSSQNEVESTAAKDSMYSSVNKGKEYKGQEMELVYTVTYCVCLLSCITDFFSERNCFLILFFILSVILFIPFLYIPGFWDTVICSEHSKVLILIQLFTDRELRLRCSDFPIARFQRQKPCAANIIHSHSHNLGEGKSETVLAGLCRRTPGALSLHIQHSQSWRESG